MLYQSMYSYSCLLNGGPITPNISFAARPRTIDDRLISICQLILIQPHLPQSCYNRPMRQFLALVIALVFVLHSSLLAAAPARMCCKSADCPMTQCVATDCLPTAMPAIATDVALPAPTPTRLPAHCSAPTMSPAPAKDVWCPPD